MKKILVIEDDAKLRNNLLLLLEAEGYLGIGASDGRRGIDAALAQRPDLILCDIMMHPLNGWDVLDVLKSRSETAAIPFCFLTAANDPQTAFRAGRTRGIERYITKPYTQSELLLAVREAVDKRPPRQNSMLLLPGALFHDRYRIEQALASGGMGVIYDVVDVRTRQHRALKVMHQALAGDAELRKKFEREAWITADVESENIVHVTDAGIDTETGRLFLVMELLKGHDLEGAGPLPPREVHDLLCQVASALEKTHAKGIVHRDLTPGNIFVARHDNGRPWVKVLDFGICHRVADSSSVGGDLGTPYYMAPEQIRTGAELSDEPRIGPACDNHALAQIAYTLLVGEPYWEPDGPCTVALLLMMKEGPKEPASQRALRRCGVELPPAFDGWFARATAVDPSSRFQNAHLLVGMMGRALGTGGLWPD